MNLIAKLVFKTTENDPCKVRLFAVYTPQVFGEGLSVSDDRAMLIDCTGTCGQAPQAKGAKSLSPPVTGFTDVADLETVPDVVNPSFFYERLPGRYCPGNKLLPPQTPKDLGAGHQCYAKCFAGACKGSEDPCFCDGFIPGFDGEDSSALCLKAISKSLLHRRFNHVHHAVL